MELSDLWCIYNFYFFINHFIVAPVKPCVSSTPENQYKPLEDDGAEPCCQLVYDFSTTTETTGTTLLHI